jgi:putative component of membrane protein insertase Oxa1/YidC/SpoIIIJ protein YidD
MQTKLFIISCFMVCNLSSQTNQLLVLKQEQLNQELALSNFKETKKKKKGIGNVFLNIYQKHVSVLISADCLYSPSCSRFSREAINTRGFFAGALLSADRLTRCSFFCGKDIPEYKFDEDGLAKDNP